MRNRTVQSVLARRSMNNGGMVAPPTQASGILRSSPSLIDAVSNDALSDMGGGTLSMAQGGAAVNMQPSYVFNQGGIARYAHGGSHSSPNGMDANNVVTKVLNGTANAEEINAIEQSSLMNQPEIARAVRLYKGIEPGGPINLRPGANVESHMKAQPGEIQQRDKARDLKVGNLTPADRKIATQTSDQMTNQRPEFDSNRLRMMGATEADIAKERQLYNEIYSSPESAFKQPAGEMSAGEAAIVQQAEAAADRPVPNFEGDNQQAFLVEERNKSGVTGFFPTNDPATDNSSREVSVEELPPLSDSSGDQEEPPIESTTEKVNAQTQMLAEVAAKTEALAAATNKNTETNAVEAIIKASDMMGGEGGSVGTDNSIIVTDPENGVATPVDQNLIFSAIKSNGGNTDEDLTLALSGDIEKMGTDLVAGKSTDMDLLKKRIEALIPAVEEDPQTQGLLIAMLGASIAGGTSSNAMTNIANGMQKALPGLINFGAKQKAAKRNRELEIGKIVLGEELQRSKEARGLTATIASETRAEKRTIAAENRALMDFVTGNKKQTLKSGRVLNAFSSYPMTRADEIQIKKDNPGLVLYPLKAVDPLDLQATSGGLNLKNQKNEAQFYNELFITTEKTIAPFKEYKSVVPLPRMSLRPAGRVILQENLPLAKKLGLLQKDKDKNSPTYGKEILRLGSIASQGDLKRFAGDYIKIAGTYKTIYDKLSELHDISTKTKEFDRLTGFQSVTGSIGDMARAIGTKVPAGETLAKYILGDAKLSARATFENKGRLVLAKITPLILGESGKTISDADRIRVARALGYEIDVVNGKEEVGKLLKNILVNPEAITHALSEVSSVIRKSYLDIHSTYQNAMISVGQSIEPFNESTVKRLTFDARKKETT